MKKRFKRCPYKPKFFFIKIEDGWKILFTCLYIDDLIYIGNDGAMFEKFKRDMMTEYNMSDLENLHYFLGFEVGQSNARIFISKKTICLRNFREVSNEKLQFGEHIKWVWFETK